MTSFFINLFGCYFANISKVLSEHRSNDSEEIETIDEPSRPLNLTDTSSSLLSPQFVNETRTRIQNVRTRDYTPNDDESEIKGSTNPKNGAFFGSVMTIGYDETQFHLKYPPYALYGLISVGMVLGIVYILNSFNII